MADLLPIEVAPEFARATVRAVPFWFHVFALNRPEGIYTPGLARDHRYRVAMLLLADFAGMRVLDVGRFGGFYVFLAERRGAERVVAVGNEQYRVGRFPLGNQAGGREGFRAIDRLLGSEVGYRRMDAGALDGLDERFAVAFFIGWRTRWGCCVCCVDGRSAAGRC